MKFRDFSIPLVVLIVLTASVVGIISSYFMGAKNPVEDVCEDIIDDELGNKVDLIPEIEKKIPRFSNV